MMVLASFMIFLGTPQQAQAQPRWFGVDMPWMAYGADFGEDFYYPGYGPNYNPSTVESYFADIQSKHMNIVRIWTMEDFSGLSFQGNNCDNPCTGVSQVFINNLVDFVRRANNHGITVYVTFLAPGDVKNHPNIATIYSSQFINNALVPVATALAPYRVMYDLMNECNYSGLSWPQLRDFGNNARVALHNISPNWVTMSTDQPSAFGSNFYSTLGGLGFDFYDCHVYSMASSPLTVTPADVGNAPLFLGEYGPNAGNGWADYSSSQNQNTVNNFCNQANSDGYSGMLAWSYVPGSSFSLQNTSSLWNMEYYGAIWGINTTIASGSYYSLTNISSGLNLDDPNGSNQVNTLLQLWYSNGATAQNWQFNQQLDGSYTLTNQAAGLNLDDPGGSNSWGQHLQLWYPNGATAQNWRATLQPDGSYTLTNEAASLNLDDPNGQGPAGTLVQLWPSNGATAQEWNLTLH